MRSTVSTRSVARSNSAGYTATAERIDTRDRIALGIWSRGALWNDPSTHTVNDQVGQIQLRRVCEVRNRARRHLRRVASQVSVEDVGADEGAHRRVATQLARRERMMSYHATLRSAAGTAMVPVSDRNSGVRASTARSPSTRNTTSSPC